MKISEKAKNVPQSMTLAITAKAKRMIAEGISVINFGAGEPDFDTPEVVKDGARAAIGEGRTKYTPVAGIAQLKKAISEKMKSRNGLDYSEDEIIVSSGAKSSLYYAMLALIDEGDEVIIPSPYWLTYPEMVKLCGGVPVFIDTKETGYKLTAQAFSDAITPKTKLLILNSPCNPTGVVYEKDLLKAIANVAVKNDICVMSDEVYENFVYDVEHISIASLGDEIKKRTIVVNGMSKSYSMTGWRVGYACAPKDVVKAMTGIQSHAAGNACSIAQYASVAALEFGDEFIEKTRLAFAGRRKLVLSLADKLPHVKYVTPEGAFYLVMNVSYYFGKKYGNKSIIGSISFAEALLDGGVAVIPCAPFGDDDAVRIAFSMSENDLKEGFDRIAAFLKNLK